MFRREGDVALTELEAIEVLVAQFEMDLYAERGASAAAPTRTASLTSASQ
jgi:hypothetical protein